jgi:hypothetical protein
LHHAFQKSFIILFLNAITIIALLSSPTYADPATPSKGKDPALQCLLLKGIPGYEDKGQGRQDYANELRRYCGY